MNKQKMFFKMVLNALLRRRSRMLIALLAVAIGATIISGLVTVYYDVPRQMGREFRSYGANLLLVPAGDNPVMQESDLERLTGILPQDKLVGISPYLYARIKVNEQPLMVAGTQFAQVQKVSPYWQVKGQWPETAADDVVIGAEVADMLRLEPGHQVTLSAADAEKKVRVAGVVKTGGAEEKFVFIKLSLLQTLLHQENQLSMAQVSIAASERDLNALINSMKVTVPGITPQLVKQVTQSEQTVLGKLQALVLLVTTVVLLLTLICVATTMMAVVTERRKEIGLKKALGAENRSIIMEFLGEGFTLGGLGGCIGTVLGFYFAQAVSMNVFGRAISFQPWIAVFSVAISILVTGLACLIPVKIATDVEPAIVLRGE